MTFTDIAMYGIEFFQAPSNKSGAWTEFNKIRLTKDHTMSSFLSTFFAKYHKSKTAHGDLFNDLTALISLQTAIKDGVKSPLWNALNNHVDLTGGTIQTWSLADLTTHVRQFVKTGGGATCNM